VDEGPVDEAAVGMTPTDHKAIGRRIRSTRVSHEITQVRLAEMVHVTQAAVSQWELGSCLPSRASQYRIADALRTTRWMLFKELVEAEDAA
jgi:transcriptional regulator with XRE-family HTH domain